MGEKAEGPRFQLPPMDFCPNCRRRRRLAFRNSTTLYMRTCDLTGRRVSSIYNPDKPFKVYYHKDWWAQERPMTDHGRDFDFDRPFFEQFLELRDAVPVESARIVNCENSEFVSNTRKSKNCFLIYGCFDCEDCLYLDGATSCKNSIVGWQVVRAENCHAIWRCDKALECFYCNLCYSCAHCWFCRWCKDCFYCFGCSQLRHRQYCIFNKQHTRAEYEDFINSINTGSRKVIDHWFQEARDFFTTTPEGPYRGFNNEDVLGDMMYNCKRSRHIFTTAGCEDSVHLYECVSAVHCLDMDNTANATGLCYQNISSTVLFNTQFGINSHSCSDCLYIMDCHQLKRCFGCVGLYNEEYCILNKNYTKTEYYALLTKIVEHMEKTGEWGQFYPPHLSRFGYNETSASGFYPLKREEAIALGFPWSDYVVPKPDLPDLLDGADMYDDIADVPDDVVHRSIQCKETQRRFKIQKHELAFLKKYRLPPPRLFPNRHIGEYCSPLRNPMRLVERQCDNVIDGNRCPAVFESAFQLDTKQLVFCEDCYYKISYG